MQVFVGKKCSRSHRAPNAIRSDGGRNPIGRRTESDRVADAVRLLNNVNSTTHAALLVYFHQTFTNRNAGVLGIICIFAEPGGCVKTKIFGKLNSKRF